MNGANLSIKTNQTAQQSKVLYIDGCKVTVRYNGQENPAAVKNIKDTLISGGAKKKS